MRTRRVVVAAFGMLLVILATARTADAHPLGNFTINHYDGLHFEPNQITDTAVIDAAEIPTAQLADGADTDHDGHSSTSERAAYAEGRCAALAGALHVTVNGRPATFTVDRSDFAYHEGVAGLDTARLRCQLVAPVDLRHAATVGFVDEFDADRVGWHEIAATANGVRLNNSPVPAASISHELARYPNDLLSSPLDVRRATFDVRPGSGASTVRPGAGAAPTAGLTSRAVAGVTAKFTDLVGRRDLTVGVGLLAVALAFVLGASHALLPGHGKTVMAAYLAGRQGSARDAVLVGATVTATHTAGVLVLGLALTLSASLAGDAVLGYLGVTSGLLVAVLGAGLLFSALRAGPAKSHHHHHDGEPHDHDHDHDHGHSHSHAETRVSRRGLIGMGVAGGLVPSPSALVVLLAAVGLGRTIFGVALVLTYGLGMAATLTAAGLVLVRVRDRMAARGRTRRGPASWLGDRWVRAMPFATAGLVMVVGVGLAGRSLGTF